MVNLDMPVEYTCIAVKRGDQRVAEIFSVVRMKTGHGIDIYAMILVIFKRGENVRVVMTVVKRRASKYFLKSVGKQLRGQEKGVLFRWRRGDDTGDSTIRGVSLDQRMWCRL
jgi:hypothetical protein